MNPHTSVRRISVVKLSQLHNITEEQQHQQHAFDSISEASIKICLKNGYKFLHNVHSVSSTCIILVLVMQFIRKKSWNALQVIGEGG